MPDSVLSKPNNNKGVLSFAQTNLESDLIKGDSRNMTKAHTPNALTLDVKSDRSVSPDGVSQMEERKEGVDISADLVSRNFKDYSQLFKVEKVNQTQNVSPAMSPLGSLEGSPERMS
mmetsp:Transcript_24022/g.36952  ORF Transcript_24022/g.36952 Transcript_24022/m.36952 type:complete len:117 (+) Transcript_24022:1387-1737(+)